MSTAYLAAASRLLRGEEGFAVRATLEETNRTLSSLHTALSRVRGIVIEAGHRHPDYETSLQALRAFASEPAVAAFLIAPLSKQLSIQRSHASIPTWPPEQEAALREVQLLPSNMTSFCLTKFETHQLKLKQEASLLQKNETLIVVPNAASLLHKVRSLLESADHVSSEATLAIALLIVSGRRSSEILNGKSTFQPVAGQETAARFTGQLKKHEEAAPYVIPLLVPYTTFASALGVLRRRQAGAVLSNRECNAEYAMPIKRELIRCERGRGPLALPKVKAHDLRSLYISYVYHMYHCSTTFARVAMQCLGHVSLLESHSYSNVRLEGCEQLTNALGVWHGPTRRTPTHADAETC